jgi:hypothetical protein
MEVNRVAYMQNIGVTILTIIVSVKVSEDAAFLGLPTAITAVSQ